MADSPSTTRTTTTAFTRRGAIGLLAGAAVVHAAAPAGASPAAAHPDGAHPHHTPGVRRTVALPDGIRPEGITSGPGTTYYVGSLADGRIVTGDLLRGSSRVLLPGATGRSLRGLFHDRRTGLVWAVGNVGSISHVWAVNGTSGAVVSDTVVPGGVFLNDLVVTARAVWVTDSQVDRLAVIRLTRRGRPTGAAAAFLPLTGRWPAFDGTNLNANGIRQLPDGSAVLNNSAVGGLWRVDTTTGATMRIPVKGGPGLSGGDGLEIENCTLYDVRGSGEAEVSVLRLRRDCGRWKADWRGALTDKTLDVPSTATLAGGRLWAVNARFGVESPDTASYRITRLPAR